MIVKEREYTSLHDLVECWIESKGESLIDLEIVSVVDEHGNINSTECDVVIEITYEDELDMEDVKLHFTWDYDDYLAVTEREDNDDTAERWVKVVALIDNKHYESVDDEIRDTIHYVDERILKEDSNDDTN